MTKDKVIKYIKVFVFLTILAFALYKIFDWKAIFDREYEAYSAVRHEPVLPPIIINSSSTERLSYEQRVYIEKVIKALGSREIVITQIEETDTSTDVNLLTSEDYRLIISTEMRGEVLINNIFNVYASDDFQKDKKVKLTFDNIKKEIDSARASTSLISNSSSTLSGETQTINASGTMSAGDQGSDVDDGLDKSKDNSKNNLRLEYVDFRFGDKVYYR